MYRTTFTMTDAEAANLIAMWVAAAASYVGDERITMDTDTIGGGSMRMRFMPGTEHPIFDGDISGYFESAKRCLIHSAPDADPSNPYYVQFTAPTKEAWRVIALAACDEIRRLGVAVKEKTVTM